MSWTLYTLAPAPLYLLGWICAQPLFNTRHSVSSTLYVSTSPAVAIEVDLMLVSCSALDLVSWAPHTLALPLLTYIEMGHVLFSCSEFKIMS